ncbi:TatD family hydrolase [Fodinibius sediminis]|uniref:TatD DNase family protein n=1 Tax=Fodinibius sediminis TaxID=1214077 RepID=A0A521E026_9BACT|nr:TatD family hydrolase [Fodinibius sediminis]SMO77317.1 TatD DNase family protein [Fodinibius sediminis]
MIDTHCHLYSDQFDDDLQEVLHRAHNAGVTHIFMPAIDLDSLDRMEQLPSSEILLYKMAGIHPTSVNEGIRTTEEKLLDWCRREDIVGVGETGLDYYWSDDHKKEQQQSLRVHCRVAREVGKPVILHNRNSTADLLDIIEEQQDGSLSGIWHCFNGSVEEGTRALDLGLHLGIGGIFTFKNAGVDTTVAKLPLDRMVLETDAPYLAPAPKRGQRNEPAFVRFTARRLAEVKNQPLEAIVESTTQTALQLFSVSE